MSRLATFVTLEEDVGHLILILWLPFFRKEKDREPPNKKKRPDPNEILKREL
jgi:hypothetical protein